MAGYTYAINVLFKEPSRECAIGLRTSKYPYCGNKTDSFNFKDNGFSIEAIRSSAYKDGDILSNNRNTLYGQIIKGLLVYYGLSKIFPQIETVQIKRKKKAERYFEYTETQSFRQPICIKNQRKYSLDLSIVDSILEESEKGNAIRIALTYWLRAVSSDKTNHIFKFDRLWRSLDRLLLYQGNTGKENDGIIAIKQLLLSNSGSFPLSIQITNTYGENDIRGFSWNMLFSKCSMSYTKTIELKRRFLEYSDYRIIKLFKGICANNKISIALNRAGLLTDVQNHFNVHSSTKSDVELVLLFALSYTYYIRCRLFHGEVPDSMFKIKDNNEDKEIQKLTELLEVVVYELLNNCSILR